MDEFETQASDLLSSEHKENNTQIKTPKRVTKADINFNEMQLLVFGYIHEQFENLTADIIKLILMKCDVLETFDNDHCRELKNEHLLSTFGRTHACTKRMQMIECFGQNGYTYGIRYLSIKVAKCNCIVSSYFGVMSITNNGLKQIKCLISLMPSEATQHTNDTIDEPIFSVKLDLNESKVTFYNHYRYIIETQSIKSAVPYVFFISYCDKTEYSLQIISTDIQKIKKCGITLSEYVSLRNSDELHRVTAADLGQFVLRKMNSKTLNRLWKHLDENQSGQIGRDEVLNALLWMAVLYVAFRFRKKGGRGQPEISKRKLKVQFIPVKDWILKTKMNTKKVVRREEFKQLIGTWLTAYDATNS